MSQILHEAGFLDASTGALDDLARAQEQERRWGADASGNRVIRHAAEIAAERRAYQADAEAARKASDPRGVLRQAHVLLTEGQGEVDRLAPLVARGRALVATIEDRARMHQAEATAARAAAAERLVEALAAGADPPLETEPVPLVGPEQLATATAALARVEAALTAASDRLERCKVGVSRCALDVLSDQAADEANAIIEADGELRRRRADLDSLSRLLTIERRRLAEPAVMPAQVSRALYPADPAFVGADRGLELTDWRAAYAALVAGNRQSEV